MPVNIQLYFAKKNFDVQKALRYFAERGIKIQQFDLAKRRLGRREFDKLCASVGLREAIDFNSKVYLENPIRFMSTDALMRDGLFADQRMLKTPIVRNGDKFTTGYKPEKWDEWLRQ